MNSVRSALIKLRVCMSALPFLCAKLASVALVCGCDQSPAKRTRQLSDSEFGDADGVVALAFLLSLLLRKQEFFRCYATQVGNVLVLPKCRVKRRSGFDEFHLS